MATRINSPLDDDIKLLAGITANASTLPSFLLAGTTTTPAECETTLEARIAAGNLVLSTRGAYQRAVQANRQELASTQPFIKDLRNQIILMHSNSPDILSQYGLKPRKKPATQTTAVKVVAVARRKATRTERGTRGPVQKKSVKGTVPSTIEIEVPGAAAPAPTITTPIAALAPHGEPPANGKQ